MNENTRSIKVFSFKATGLGGTFGSSLASSLSFAFSLFLVAVSLTVI